MPYFVFQFFKHQFKLFQLALILRAAVNMAINIIINKTKNIFDFINKKMILVNYTLKNYIILLS